jgi:arylsulfatase A-like enzyme
MRAKKRGSKEMSPASKAKATQPNIVFFLWDNLGWGEVACYGGGVLRGAATPRIDALAAQGLRLLNFNVEAQCNTNWEGGWRVPAFVRWPGKFKAGTVLNGLVSMQDWLPTLLAAAGEPDINAKLLNGHKAGDKTFKVHIDGLNMLPYLTGEVKESPRKFFFYMSDDGDVLALRMGDWKMVLAEQRAKTLMCWVEPFVKLRGPKLFNLRRDPFERADENSNTYFDWMISHVYLVCAMQALVAQQIENFVKYPPRQKAAAFNLDEVMRKLQDATGGANH